MKDKHSSTTNESLTKNMLLGTYQVSKKIRGVFVPEDKRAGKAIKYIIINSLRVPYIWKAQGEEGDTKFLLLCVQWYLVM